MPYDPNHVTPCGKTYAQIDADQERYVAAANDALASIRGFGCCWWNYSVSHCSFELLVGDPLGHNNLVIGLAACDHISGPVAFANQQLQVIWDNDRERDQPWLFTLQDESGNFKAVAGVFGWRRNVDLLKLSKVADSTGKTQSDTPAAG